MPCYLFTWHTYGSWLPDRPEGYVHWLRGLQPTSPPLAVRYDEQQKETVVLLDEEHQLATIDELRKAAPLQRLRLHMVACEGVAPAHPGELARRAPLEAIATLNAPLAF